MKLRKATSSLVFAFIAAIMVGSMMAGCSSEEFEYPQKTMAKRTRSADGMEPFPTDQAFMNIPENQDECALWSLTKLKIQSGAYFDQYHTVADYYNDLKSKAIAMGWSTNTSFASIILQLGMQEGVLNSVIRYDTIPKLTEGDPLFTKLDSIISAKDSLVRTQMKKKPKLVGIMNHVGLYSSKNKTKVFYESCDGIREVNYSEVVALFY